MRLPSITAPLSRGFSFQRDDESLRVGAARCTAYCSKNKKQICDQYHLLVAQSGLAFIYCTWCEPANDHGTCQRRVGCNWLAHCSHYVHADCGLSYGRSDSDDSMIAHSMLLMWPALVAGHAAALIARWVIRNRKGRTPGHGYEPTREAAMAAFKKSC
jgi:hypothetical protein